MRASRRLRAVLAAGVLAVTAPARGDDLRVDPGQPAPEVSAPLVWRESHGWWFTDKQVVKLNARIDYLEKKASKECVDAQIDAAARMSVWWKVAGAVVAGAAVGYCAAASGHCGMYR